MSFLQKKNLVNEKFLVSLLELENFDEIYKEADKVCQENFSNQIHIRALLEFSNYCKRKCIYCGLNSQSTSVTRYRMSPDDIVAASLAAYDVGYKTIVLQSGEDGYFTAEILGDIVKRIKSDSPIAITLSCGELSYEDYAYLKKCGADRYLLKHETSDEKIYSHLHPCGTLENRISCLKNIKNLGYLTGGGFMIGLPNQTTDTIASDLLLLYEIGCDMAGIGPFIASPNTALANHPNGSTELTLRAVALARLLLPKAYLPATTALGVLEKAQKEKVFSCGANVVMQKITPVNHRKDYAIYPSDTSELSIQDGRKAVELFIKGMNKTPI